jgi:UPF0148 protein
MDSEKDQKVKRIARFLELGGTMLAEHCKVCGAPRFRYQGKVICPICDVRDEEEEAPEPVSVEVQVPETKSHTEKDRSSFETKKRIQPHRQKSRFGLKPSETAGESEKTLGSIEEEISKTSSDADEAKKAVPVFQAAPLEDVEKPVEIQKISAVYESRDHVDGEVLERLLFKKMISIATSLQDEKNPRSIAEDFELIEKGIGLIERLRQV